MTGEVDSQMRKEELSNIRRQNLLSVGVTQDEILELLEVAILKLDSERYSQVQVEHVLRLRDAIIDMYIRNNPTKKVADHLGVTNPDKFAREGIEAIAKYKRLHLNQK
jgi:hypothetical protein